MDSVARTSVLESKTDRDKINLQNSSAPLPPQPAEAYKEFGLDRAYGDPRALYLDLTKRAVSNLLYEDISFLKYDHRRQPHKLNRFDLKARMWGEDMPTEAHTMIGWRRLANIQECAESIFRHSVKGDFVETGIYRGGSAIFMRAILKAFESTDRKVFACDVFAYEAPRTDKVSRCLTFLGAQILKIAVRIPLRRWRTALFRFLEARHRAFPRTEQPSDDWINISFFFASHINDVRKTLEKKDRTSLQAVQSNFARYGLLDPQVVFLEGYFSETLPKANIQTIALLRCDGDSFESTYGVLHELYSKVSPGGFVIIDDYNAFSDCKDAVDRFRQENNVQAPLIPIDNLSMYWQKPLV